MDWNLCTHFCVMLREISQMWWHTPGKETVRNQKGWEEGACSRGGRSLTVILALGRETDRLAHVLVVSVSHPLLPLAPDLLKTTYARGQGQWNHWCHLLEQQARKRKMQEWMWGDKQKISTSNSKKRWEEPTVTEVSLTAQSSRITSWCEPWTQCLHRSSLWNLSRAEALHLFALC